MPSLHLVTFFNVFYSCTHSGLDHKDAQAEIASSVDVPLHHEDKSSFHCHRRLHKAVNRETAPITPLFHSPLSSSLLITSECFTLVPTQDLCSFRKCELRVPCSILKLGFFLSRKFWQLGFSALMLLRW